MLVWNVEEWVVSVGVFETNACGIVVGGCWRLVLVSERGFLQWECFGANRA